jgi:hypothetical protein
MRLRSLVVARPADPRAELEQIGFDASNRSVFPFARVDIQWRFLRYMPTKNPS